MTHIIESGGGKRVSKPNFSMAVRDPSNVDGIAPMVLTKLLIAIVLGKSSGLLIRGRYFLRISFES